MTNSARQTGHVPPFSKPFIVTFQPVIILVKYNSIGNLIWNQTWGGASTERGWGITTIGDDIYLTGDQDDGTLDMVLL